MEEFLILVLGLLVSIGMGGIVVKYLNAGLKRYIGDERPCNKLTPTMSCIERFIYTLLFCNNEYQIIAILFGLMAAQKIASVYVINKAKESKNRLSLYREIMEKINVYFISSFVSLLFGILGGVIILNFWE